MRHPKSDAGASLECVPEHESPRPKRSYSLRASRLIVFVRPDSNPRYIAWIYAARQWHCYELSPRPAHALGIDRHLETCTRIPYDPAVRRIGLRDCPWPVQYAIRMRQAELAQIDTSSAQSVKFPKLTRYGD